MQIHYEDNGSTNTLGTEVLVGVYPRTGRHLRGGSRETFHVEMLVEELEVNNVWNLVLSDL